MHMKSLVWTIAAGAFGIGAAQAIQVDPTRFILHLEQGESYTGSIQLVHGGDTAIGIDVTTLDETAHNPSVTSAWYQVDDRDLELPPHSNTAFPFAIQVPPAATGELHMRLAFAEKRPMQNAPVTVIPVMAVPVYVQVKNTELYEVAVHDLFIKSNDPLTVGMTIENKGNVQIRPVPLCRITRRDNGETAAVLFINKQNSNDIGWPIFPGKKDTLQGRVNESAPYPQSLSPGDYVVEASFEINGQEYRKVIDATIP